MTSVSAPPAASISQQETKAASRTLVSKLEGLSLLSWPHILKRHQRKSLFLLGLLLLAEEKSVLADEQGHSEGRGLSSLEEWRLLSSPWPVQHTAQCSSLAAASVKTKATYCHVTLTHV